MDDTNKLTIISEGDSSEYSVLINFKNNKQRFKCVGHNMDKEFECLACHSMICLLCVEKHKSEPNFSMRNHLDYKKEEEILKNTIETEKNYLIDNFKAIITEKARQFIDSELFKADESKQIRSKIDLLEERLRILADASKTLSANRNIIGNNILNIFRDIAVNKIDEVDEGEYVSAKSIKSGSDKSSKNEDRKEITTSQFHFENITRCVDCGNIIHKDHEWKTRCIGCYENHMKVKGFERRNCVECNRWFNCKLTNNPDRKCQGCKKHNFS
jgi:hypothetical protein